MLNNLEDIWLEQSEAQDEDVDEQENAVMSEHDWWESLRVLAV